MNDPIGIMAFDRIGIMAFDRIGIMAFDPSVSWPSATSVALSSTGHRQPAGPRQCLGIMALDRIAIMAFDCQPITQSTTQPGHRPRRRPSA